jgi:hypothetical protein
MYKKKAPYRKKAPMRRTKRSYGAKRSYGGGSKPYDGQNVIVSSYMEVQTSQKTTDAGKHANGGFVGYSIPCNPNNCLVKYVATPKGTDENGIASNGHLTAGAVQADNAVISSGGKVSFTRLDQLSVLYRQFRINSFTIKVTVDRHCGLDNPLMICSDRLDDSAPTLPRHLLDQAHKTKVLTEADRTMTYTWVSKTPREKEFHMLQDRSLTDIVYLKVFQEIEPNATTVCKHRIEITASVSLKDSASAAIAGTYIPQGN